MKEGAVIKLIFGLKVQQLRQEAELSYQQLSDRTGLALSYLHSIEKGKKYPKADKILQLAKALDTEYDYLVSLEPSKKLRPIVDLLRSDFLKIFPLDTFGISTNKLIELLAQAPEKTNAFISTVLKITRNFNMQGEDFYKAALRSYQDLHSNYFSEIEDAVEACAATLPDFPSVADLSKYLTEQFGIKIDRTYVPGHEVLKHLQSVYHKKDKTLFLGSDLATAHTRFLLAKEIGFQVLQLKERPLETRMLEVDSFEKLMSNFQASYFAVALLLPRPIITRLLDEMRAWNRWQGDRFLLWLEAYDVTAEMLLQRFANILPQHLGVKQLFFLRFYRGQESQKYIITKEMHLSQLHDPHANQLDEHYCRRWISIHTIKQLRARQQLHDSKEPLVAAQISRYWNTPNAYFCISVAKPTRSDLKNTTSVTIGLLVNDHLRSMFPFLADPEILTKDVHTTCERCPILDCGARAVPPVFLQRQYRRDDLRRALAEMKKRKF